LPLDRNEIVAPAEDAIVHIQKCLSFCGNRHPGINQALSAADQTETGSQLHLLKLGQLLDLKSIGRADFQDALVFGVVEQHCYVSPELLGNPFQI
jgi:hypothetical protein